MGIMIGKLWYRDRQYGTVSTFAEGGSVLLVQSIYRNKGK